MNTPVREGETIEGSLTMRNRPYQVLKCSSPSVARRETSRQEEGRSGATGNVRTPELLREGRICAVRTLSERCQNAVRTLSERPGLCQKMCGSSTNQVGGAEMRRRLRRVAPGCFVQGQTEASVRGPTPLPCVRSIAGEAAAGAAAQSDQRAAARTVGGRRRRARERVREPLLLEQEPCLGGKGFFQCMCKVYALSMVSLGVLGAAERLARGVEGGEGGLRPLVRRGSGVNCLGVAHRRRRGHWRGHLARSAN